MAVHPKHVSRMETGEANVTVATLVSAATAYGVRMAELFE